MSMITHHGQLWVFSGINAELEPLPHRCQGCTIFPGEDRGGEEDFRKQGPRVGSHQVARLILAIQGVDEFGKLICVQLLKHERGITAHS